MLLRLSRLFLSLSPWPIQRTQQRERNATREIQMLVVHHDERKGDWNAPPALSVLLLFLRGHSDTLALHVGCSFLLLFLLSTSKLNTNPFLLFVMRHPLDNIVQREAECVRRRRDVQIKEKGHQGNTLHCTTPLHSERKIRT